MENRSVYILDCKRYSGVCSENVEDSHLTKQKKSQRITERTQTNKKKTNVSLCNK